MTQSDTTPQPSKNAHQDPAAGVRRPDQGGTNQPGQTQEGPASGGEGAAGAGGPKGFGTGQ